MIILTLKQWTGKKEGIYLNQLLKNFILIWYLGYFNCMMFRWLDWCWEERWYYTKYLKIICVMLNYVRPLTVCIKCHYYLYCLCYLYYIKSIFVYIKCL